MKDRDLFSYKITMLKSKRYIKEGQFEYIIPTPIKSNEKAKELFIKAMENDQKSYDEIVEVLMQEYVPQFLSLGLNALARFLRKYSFALLTRPFLTTLI